MSVDAVAKTRVEDADSIASAIAHEVNNLLTPVVGLADLLEHTGCDDELRDQLVKQAVDRCQRAVAICDLLVNLAKTVVPGEQSDIAVGARHAVCAVDKRAEDAGVRIENCVQDSGCTAVPEVVVQHVLMNLLINAIAASEPGATVMIQSRFQPGNRWVHANWYLSVQDRGRGLDTRQAMIINHGGFPHGSKGIGLAVVRMLCERWGGEIRVDSEPGIGSTFHVKLPAA